MRQSDHLETCTLTELKRQAIQIAREGSRAEVGSMILGLSRRIRKECRGQLPGIPDLTSHKPQMAEGALVYEYLPELAQRFLTGSGADMLRTAEERAVPDLDHFTDEDLRLAIGDGLRASRFAAISARLRLLQEPRSFATEIFAGDLHDGNVIEIATSRLIPAFKADHPSYRKDSLQFDRDRAMRKHATHWHQEISPDGPSSSLGP